jgi:hypothetical protein
MLNQRSLEGADAESAVSLVALMLNQRFLRLDCKISKKILALILIGGDNDESAVSFVVLMLNQRPLEGADAESAVSLAALMLNQRFLRLCCKIRKKKFRP